MLSQLPYLLGPYGQLAVVGVGPNDWLDLEALALACSEMPPGSVHWFGAFPSDVEATFGESLTHHEGSFVDLIRRTTASVAGEALRQARMALDRPPSRSLTVRTREGPTVALQLAPEDWRNMGQVGVLLADDYIAPPSPIGADEAREALRAFLRHQQYVPDWEAIGRGFLFERENGQGFLEQIEGSATALGSVRDDVGGDRRSGSRPLFLLTGPPACGKSRLLHWLAYQLRRRGHAVLYLVSPAGRVHPESVERACRLIEGKGAAHVIVAADGLDDASYLQLNEHLATSGRNAVVLGARSAAQRDTDADDPRQRSGFTPFRPLPVPPLLTSNELNRFTEYLSAHGFSG